MLTELQQHKFDFLKNNYIDTVRTYIVVEDDKIIQILRDNGWHVGDAARDLMSLHNTLVEDFKRIEADKHIIRPEDISEEMIEIWSHFYRCRTCGSVAMCEVHRDKYCPNCGTKVDWSMIK